MGILISVFILLLLVSAYLSCVHSAFVSQNEYSILTIEGKDERKLELLKSLIHKKDRILTSMLAMNLFINISATIVCTSIITDYIIKASPEEQWDIFIAIFVSATIILIFGEILPSLIGNAKSNTICYKSAGFLNFMCMLSKPFYGLLNGFNTIILKLIKKENLQLTHHTTIDEIRLIAVHGREAGIIDDFGYKMISKSNYFNIMTASDVMIPANKVISLNERDDFKRIKEVFLENMYSRMPVYNADSSDVIGIFNYKEICKISFSDTEDFNINKHLQETLFVPDSILIGNLLEKMRNVKSQMAIVQNEYGVIIGLVTMSDIIERIFGKIDDEYEGSKQSRLIEKTKSINEAIVDGTTSLVDITNILKIEFDKNTMVKFKTVNSFLVSLKGSFLEEKDEFSHNNYIFRVESVKNQFAEKVFIKEIKPE